ncbi:MAG: hypothetical protein MUF44_07030, partial [Hydrogenophaga sp.]|nr:hypothetical protein [Hydrogenophaga sp.]
MRPPVVRHQCFAQLQRAFDLQLAVGVPGLGAAAVPVGGEQHLFVRVGFAEPRHKAFTLSV